jgi:hypothetical protein
MSGGGEGGRGGGGDKALQSIKYIQGRDNDLTLVYVRHTSICRVSYSNLDHFNHEKKGEMIPLVGCYLCFEERRLCRVPYSTLDDFNHKI